MLHMGGVALTWLALPQLTDTVIGDAELPQPHASHWCDALLVVQGFPARLSEISPEELSIRYSSNAVENAIP